MRQPADVIKEHYGAEASENKETFLKISLDDGFDTCLHPRDKWAKTKFPYEALSYPPLPSLDEIEKAMVESRLSPKIGLFQVCRVGACVVKRGSDPRLLGVGLVMLYDCESNR
jgi:hypothetical protein